MSTSHACGLEEGRHAKERYQRYHEEKAKRRDRLTISSNVALTNSFTSATTKLFPICSISRSVFTNTVRPSCARSRDAASHTRGNGCPRSARPPFAKRYIEVFRKKWTITISPAWSGQDYGAAARRCKEGGLNGIETLGNSHLIGQTNKRTDQ